MNTGSDGNVDDAKLNEMALHTESRLDHGVIDRWLRDAIVAQLAIYGANRAARRTALPRPNSRGDQAAGNPSLPTAPIAAAAEPL